MIDNGVSQKQAFLYLEQLNAIGEFEGVYSAEKTYPIMATMDILDSNNVVAVKHPNETEEYPVVI